MNDIDFYSNKNEPISGVNLIKRKELEMKVGSFESIAKSRFSLREYDLKNRLIQMILNGQLILQN